jgi:hypothetical protein
VTAVELVNRTPLAADLVVTDLQNGGPRLGILVAKATYTVAADGQCALDAEAPLAILADDEETELGLLPRDDLPREDDAFEVILLGRAHAPNGQSALRTKVRLQIGHEVRELAVWGDRVWNGQGKGASIGDPAPFTSLPLTWDRAFGGRSEIEIDRESFVTLDDPRNPAGRGFDPTERAKQIGKLLSAPRGYPRAPEVRPLPNLEDPAQLIRAWSDAPRPACWATVPMDTWLHVERGIANPGQPDDPSLELTPGIHHRAHPDLVLPRPAAGAVVQVDGVRPDGLWRFELPRLRVLVDFIVGDTRGQDELVPHMLLLLPEERRFVLLLRRVFEYPFAGGEERSVRLRTGEGWYGDPIGQEVPA